MLPSRRIRKVTSARNALLGGGRNWSAICRTTFCRYTGYGNSIPSVRALATSAPRPPVGPPPATGPVVVDVGAVEDFGAVADFGVAAAGLVVAAFGVAILGAFTGGASVGAFMRSGSG